MFIRFQIFKQLLRTFQATGHPANGSLEEGTMISIWQKNGTPTAGTWIKPRRTIPSG
jgi:hypothetical protein